jgi:hypothetical protein
MIDICWRGPHFPASTAAPAQPGPRFLIPNLRPRMMDGRRSATALRGTPWRGTVRDYQIPAEGPVAARSRMSAASVAPIGPGRSPTTRSSPTFTRTIQHSIHRLRTTVQLADQVPDAPRAYPSGNRA